MRKSLVASLCAIFAVSAIGSSPAWGMGLDNAYDNMQTGVTYTVYQPTYTAGLKAQHVGGNDLCQPGTEENLWAFYGKKSGRFFSITEGNPMCSDIGVGEEVLKAKVGKATATVVAYCDPTSSAPCTKGSVATKGGHLEVMLPAAPNLRPTRVFIETYGAKNLSAEQLVKIARGMIPAA